MKEHNRPRREFRLPRRQFRFDFTAGIQIVDKEQINAGVGELRIRPIWQQTREVSIKFLTIFFSIAPNGIVGNLAFVPAINRGALARQGTFAHRLAQSEERLALSESKSDN